MSSRPTSPIIVGLVMGALLACSSEDTVDEQQLREDVLYCEDAIGVLESCCPGFVADELACVHYVKKHEPSCGDGTYSTVRENPALDLAESQCIREMSCSGLVSSGVCKRAQAARAQKSSDSWWVEGGSTKGPHSGTAPRTRRCVMSARRWIAAAVAITMAIAHENAAQAEEAPEVPAARTSPPSRSPEVPRHSGCSVFRSREDWRA